ncbi:MAG: hypothetical protein NTY19_51925 [Planctomycetota bacterium]|nr:hypothetical protein [Planctomycetota bacterium]
MTEFDPYYKWLGIPPAEQPPDHYRLLTLCRFEPDPEVIEAAAERIATFLQTVATGQYVAESQQLLNQVATARRCLLKAESRVTYDAQLRARHPDAVPIPPPAPPLPAASATRPQLGSSSALGTPRRVRVAASRPARPLVLAAVGGALTLVLGLAALAWGLRGNSQSTPTRVKAAEKSSPTTAASAAKPAPPAPAFPLAFQAAPPNQELDVVGWRPTRSSAKLRVEKGALVLEGTGAATTDFRPVEGPVTIELKAGGEGAGQVRVLWTEIGLPEFTPERSVELPLAAGSQWQELTALLPVRGRLTGLRIDPPEGPSLFELDWVHIRDAAGKTVKEWGFGASAGKHRKARSFR